MNPNSLSLPGVNGARQGSSPATVRRMGMLILFVGAALALGAGCLALQLAPTLLNPGELIGGERFTGSAALGRQMLALLTVVALTGAVAACAGLQQWRSGQRGGRLLVLAAVMFAATLAMVARTAAMLA